MRSEYTIQEELKELNSSLPPVKGSEVYAVPDGYFEGLAEAILARVKATSLEAGEEIETLSPLLASLSRKVPFDVPAGYFQSLNTEAATEETLPIAWKEARFNPTYSVPDGYFDQFPERMLTQVAPKHTTGKVISMSQRIMRYATAACLTGLVAMASWLYFGKPGVINVQEHPNKWVASKLQNTSTQELDAFMQTADATHEIVSVPKTSKPEVKKLLKDISDKELDAFLEQVPGDDEVIDLN